MNCFSIRFLRVFIFLLGPILFMLGLVILCFVYLLFVTVWSSVPVQLIARKDSSLKLPIIRPVGH